MAVKWELCAFQNSPGTRAKQKDTTVADYSGSTLNEGGDEKVFDNVMSC